MARRVRVTSPVLPAPAFCTNAIVVVDSQLVGAQHKALAHRVLAQLTKVGVVDKIMMVVDPRPAQVVIGGPTDGDRNLRRESGFSK